MLLRADNVSMMLKFFTQSYKCKSPSTDGIKIEAPSSKAADTGVEKGDSVTCGFIPLECDLEGKNEPAVQPEAPVEPLSYDQKAVLHRVQQGHNVFFTGSAGEKCRIQTCFEATYICC